MHKIKENAKEISEEKLNELKENAYGILSECRRNLINRAPFTGTVAMSLEIVPTRDQRIETACTDGQHVYFDIDFLSSLSPEEQNFVFSHEIWHCLLAHFLRGEGYPDRDRLNIAQDLEINQILAQEVDENGAASLSVPSSALLPEKYHLPKGLSAEQYYELLEDRENIVKQILNMSGGAGAGGAGGKNSQISGHFDRHLTDSDNVFQEQEKENIADKYGKITFDKDFQPECKEATASKMRETAMAASQICEQRMRGSLPAHLQRFVNKLMKPEIKWQDVMQDFVTRTIGDKSDWNRPNRRFVSSGTYLPSHQGEMLNVGVIIDTSGSTSGDIPKFLGELNSLVKTFGNYTLNILQIDAKVNSHDVYNEENPLELEDVEFSVNGGGGTNMKPAFDYLKENDIECDSLILLTDGETDDITEDYTDLPLLTVICNGGTTDHIKYGEVVTLKSKE